MLTKEGLKKTWLLSVQGTPQFYVYDILEEVMLVF